MSNAGPDQTLALAGGESEFERSYVARLRTNAADAPIFHLSFVMDRPLLDDFDGCLVFGNNPFYVERYFVGGTQVGQRVRLA